MNFPSTNTDGANPSAGDVVSNVESSHGVRLSGGSTGGIVTAVGDDANISLNIRPKGSGGLILGTASTSPVVMTQRYLVQATVPALSSGASAESTVTVLGLTTNSVLILQNRLILNTSVVGITATPRCSTADELTIEWHNISVSSISGSTQSFYLLQFAF